MVVIKMKKIVFSSAVRCYRSACSHPFLVALLCFLVFLYRSSPFVFSLLVSASPVLICTALLLGTLLSLGQPNLPDIEPDDKTSQEIVCLKTGVLGDTTVVHNNEQLNTVTNGIAEVVRGDCNDLDPEHQDLGVSEDDLRNIHVSQNSDTDDEDVEMQNDRSPAESFGSERVNVDSLDSPPGSPWKHVEEEEPNGEDDEDTDSGSDGAESSSPDASMADIIPMLDELHPLLEEDAPHLVPQSDNGFDAGSEHSPSSGDSDENMEKDEPVEAVNEDVDDEDEGHGSRDGQAKSAITWTDEDQKNLMDLGTSELERNQRLESLIARRRARKNMSMMAERNLIDFETTDLPFNVAPIVTARNNPFDLPHPHDDMGLPPIPGSAPSILLARRNPFDLPYDSNEEKPDLLGDSFEQEFESVLPREPFFRRHESFNIGPSFFVPSRLERHDDRLRPYFIAENMHSVGTSYSSYQRQLSGRSESKASSNPETDSVASAGDYDANILQRGESLGSVELKESSRNFDGRNISGDEDVSRESDGISVTYDKNDIRATPLDEELISNIDHVSERVGHGSQTSEETDVLEVEERDKEGNGVEIDSDPNPISFEVQHTSSYVNLNVTETSSSVEADKQDTECTSEVRERMFYDKEGGELSRSEGSEDSGGELSSSEVAEDARIAIIEGSSCNMTADISQKEPVYDSSPPADRHNLYVSSDLHVELETQPVLRTGSFSERELESSKQDLDGSSIKDTSQIYDSGDDQPASRTFVAEPSSDTKSSQDSAVQGDYTSKTETECLEDQSSGSIDRHILAVNVPHAGSQTVLEHSDENEAPLLISDADVVCDTLIDTEEKQIFAQNVTAEYGEELVYLDKSVDEASSSRENHGEQNAAIMHEELTDQSRSSENLDTPVAQELVQEVFTNTSSSTSPESISVISEACESRADEGYSDVESNGVQEYGDDDHPMEDIKFTVGATETRSIDDDDNVEEIKEIDEAFLSELDPVGDFSIVSQGSSSNQLENVVASVEEDSPKSRDVHMTSTVDPNPEVQVVETELSELVDVKCKKDELMSSQMEFMLGSSDTMHHPGLVDGTSSYGMHVLANEGVDGKNKIGDALGSQLPLDEATTSESRYHEQHGSSSPTDTSMQFPNTDAELLQTAKLDYDQSHKGSGPSQDGVHVEEIKDFGQTSSELPAVEASYADDYEHIRKPALECHDDEVMQSKSVDRSPEL